MEKCHDARKLNGFLVVARWLLAGPRKKKNLYKILHPFYTFAWKSKSIPQQDA